MPTTSPVGLVGVVVSRLRGAAGPGEVRVVSDGLPHTYIAHSDQELQVGNHVLVIGTRGGRQLDVEPWLLPAEYGSTAVAHGQSARS